MKTIRFRLYTGWQFHNGRYKLIFSLIEIGKMRLKRPLLNCRPVSKNSFLQLKHFEWQSIYSI